MSKKACGQHTDLASNDAVKVTRCTCGTVHLTIHASGVTMRLAPEVFRNFAAGLRAAEVRFTEAADAEISATGSQSIN